MAKRSTRIDWDEVRRYAVAGARVRLQDLREEMSKILSTFPQLGLEAGVPALPPRGAVSQKRTGGRRTAMTAAQRRQALQTAARPTESSTSKQRGSREMSAAARRRISAAQKKRWAEWRKQKKA